MSKRKGVNLKSKPPVKKSHPDTGCSEFDMDINTQPEVIASGRTDVISQQGKPVPKVQPAAFENIPNELKSLKHCEIELLICLQDIDLVSLAGKVADCGIATDFLKAVFKSLDPSVPCQLIARYLLLNVYKGLHVNTKTNFKQWLKLLENKGASGVVSQVKQFLAKTSGSGHVSVACKGSEIGDEDTILNEGHISDLTEILAGCSSKWKEIAISLRLPKNEIDNITMLSVSKPILCLNEIITSWIRGQYHSAKPPTLEVLKQALRSKTVGLGSEASNLKQNLATRMHGIIYPQEELFVEVRENSDKFSIVGQTQDVIITEGNYVLIHVQVQCHVSCSSEPTYQWCVRNNVDLQPPQSHRMSFYGLSGVLISVDEPMASEDLFQPIQKGHCKHYHGMNDSILCILVSDLTFEESYYQRVR